MDDKIEVTVEERWSDWHCCLTSDSRVWECGRTKSEAIGKLMTTLAVDGKIIIHENKAT